MVDERTTVKPDDYIVKDLYGKGFSAVQYGLNARHANNYKWYFKKPSKWRTADLQRSKSTTHTLTTQTNRATTYIQSKTLEHGKMMGGGHAYPTDRKRDRMHHLFWNGHPTYGWYQHLRYPDPFEICDQRWRLNASLLSLNTALTR